MPRKDLRIVDLSLLCVLCAFLLSRKHQIRHAEHLRQVLHAQVSEEHFALGIMGL
jgi:hypothetical protein